MTLLHSEIYKKHTTDYELLRSRMDYEKNLLTQLNTVVNFENKNVVEFASGTGTLTRLIAPMANSIKAFDLSEEMLGLNRKITLHSGFTNCEFAVADNRKIPLPDNCADIVLEGWSLGYIVAASGENWKIEIEKVLFEMERLLLNGGTAIIVATLGTGAHHPKPPNKLLENLYNFLEQEKGFSVTSWFKTDYMFDSVEEAERLVRFFWSDSFGDYVKEKKLQHLPECTAIWHKKIRK
jgi:ubiquinone/menaquinone biosynthesis C-methylase UbiE